MGRSRKPLWDLFPPRVRIPPFPPYTTHPFGCVFLFNCRIIQYMITSTVTVNGEAKPAVAPNTFDDMPGIWQTLGLPNKQPAIVIVGGAGGMSEDDIIKVKLFLERYLVPYVQQMNAAIVDGGTDSGVMAAIGRARHMAGAVFPLIGILARDVEDIKSMLEPFHTHFVMCPGTNWGDESEWIAVAAETLAGTHPKAAILINGGKIAWNDALNCINHGVQVLIAEGSGRTADVIATTSTGASFDKQALALLRTGKVHVANFFKDPARFMEKLDRLMK